MVALEADDNLEQQDYVKKYEVVWITQNTAQN
jgi:hypothetical protein